MNSDRGGSASAGSGDGRSASPLRQLADRIADAQAMKLIPSLDALAEWHELSSAAIHRYEEQFMSEPEFKRYSGRGTEWCRTHFTKYLELGSAKLVGKRRFWERRASPPRRADTDPEHLQQEIVSSFTQER